MGHYQLLISPEARGAYFADYLDVARAELSAVADIQAEHLSVGSMEFMRLACDEDTLDRLCRLSFVQGVFAESDLGLRPLSLEPGFQFEDDFVFGAKYRGKTNERLTQMLLNVALATHGGDGRGLKLLDPMCGRGTTLLWALRYGLKARGIEQNCEALDDVRRNLKRYCKLQRQKHSLREGFVGKSNRAGYGKFLEFSAGDGELKLIAGDARETVGLLQGERFDLLVGDLPYGVQHGSEGRRNPLQTVQDCAVPWRDSLRVGGVMVLAFNRYLPKRSQLERALAGEGLQLQSFTAPHRMSESIVRDVLVLKREA